LGGLRPPHRRRLPPRPARPALQERQRAHTAHLAFFPRKTAKARTAEFIWRSCVHSGTGTPLARHASTDAARGWVQATQLPTALRSQRRPATTAVGGARQSYSGRVYVSAPLRSRPVPARGTPANRGKRPPARPRGGRGMASLTHQHEVGGAKPQAAIRGRNRPGRCACAPSRPVERP